MKTLFERYNELDIDAGLLSLEKQEEYVDYYCYPVNAKPIGFEGSIMYCFVEGYEEMIFASNPESYGDEGQVYPLARNFEDFLRLVVACGSANPVEQIVWMSRAQFENHLKEEQAARTERQKGILEKIRTELGITPMEDPYAYVKEVQKDFDGSKIIYSDMYYETLGIDREDTLLENQGFSFEPIMLEIEMKE